MNVIIRRHGEFFYTLCEECGRRVVLDGDDPKDAEGVLEAYGWTERGGAVVCPACIDTRGLRLKSAAALVKAPSVALGFNREDVIDELIQMSEKLSDIQYFDGDVEELTKALEGDGEEAAAFQLSCSMLNNDVDALLGGFKITRWASTSMFSFRRLRVAVLSITAYTKMTTATLTSFDLRVMMRITPQAAPPKS